MATKAPNQLAGNKRYSEQYSNLKNYLDNCRRKRNISEYDAAGTISEKEAVELLKTVKAFKIELEEWLKSSEF